MIKNSFWFNEQSGRGKYLCEVLCTDISEKCSCRKKIISKKKKNRTGVILFLVHVVLDVVKLSLLMCCKVLDSRDKYDICVHVNDEMMMKPFRSGSTVNTFTHVFKSHLI